MKTKTILFFIGVLLLAACGQNTVEESTEAPPPVLTGNPAIDALTQQIRQDPTNAALFAKRGQAFLDNEGYDEAIVDFTYAIQYDSLKVDYYHILADTYLDYFKSRKALQVMKKAAIVFPNDIPTLLKLSEYNLILKQYEESMKTIDRVLQQDPQNAMGYFLFGMNFKESGDTVRAINSFQKSVELDAELIDSWLNLGQLYESIGDPLAARYFDNAIRIAPNDVIALHSKADYLSNQNDLEGAIDLYRKIIRADPQYEVAYFNSGLIYMDMDSITQAKNQFDLTLKMSPTHIRAYYYRGLAKEMLGNTEAAISDYKQALKMAPNYEYAQDALNRLGK